MTFSSSPRVTGLVLAGLLGLGSLLAACGDDDADSGTPETTAGSGYEQIPMEDVLAALPGILAAGEAAEVAAEAGDFDTVLAEYEELHEIWAEVEGTIKATDPDIYEAIETAQGLIKDGGETENAERVATGVADQADAINSFIEGNS